MTRLSVVLKSGYIYCKFGSELMIVAPDGCGTHYPFVKVKPDLHVEHEKPSE
jgi:hypothetical protein